MGTLARIHADDDHPLPPTSGGRLRLSAVREPEGPWGYQRPIAPELLPYFDSRPLAEQFPRTYPDREHPVCLTTQEAASYGDAC